MNGVGWKFLTELLHRSDNHVFKNLRDECRAVVVFIINSKLDLDELSAVTL